MPTRRAILRLAAAGVAAPILTGLDFSAALGLPATSFQYGVASGDPLPGGFVIWTRVTPDPGATPGSGLGAATQVRWIVATDASLTAVVAQGVVTTDPASDHTVKVDVVGLAADTQYFYGFEIVATGERSRVGAARTAPATTSSPDRLRFALVSCSNYEAGYFAPYRYLATRCLDFVLHVGDYTYEYGNGVYGDGDQNGRLHDPTGETVTLEDYRRRQAIYKADADLQDLHASCAWITTMDDHEVTNDAWRDGAENHQPFEGAYGDRRAAAFQAYAEWMPIRVAAPSPSGEVIWYRTFRFGNLAELIMLDLRQYRDQQPTTFAPVPGSAGDPTRIMLGAGQSGFVTTAVGAFAPRWRLIGNSVQLMQVDYPPIGAFTATGGGSERNTDAWDGYIAARAALQSLLASQSVDTVVLTGDIHSSWAAELPVFTGGAVTTPYASMGVEFVCPSVTSDGFKEALAGLGILPQLPALLGATLQINPHIKLLDGVGHGCCVIEVRQEHTQCDWIYTTSAMTDERWDLSPTFTRGYSYRTLHGTKSLTSVQQGIVDDCTPPLITEGPPAVIPEAGLPVLLPASAAAMAVGAAVALRRRSARVAAAERSEG